MDTQELEADRLAYSDANCSIRRTLEVIGEKWSLLVIREAFFGLRRFDDFQRALGCPRNLLSSRLTTLVEQEILARVDYREPGQRGRSEYRLTEKGLALFPIIVALVEWGDRYTADPAGPAVEIRHRGCGADVHVHLACEAGHDHLGARDAQSFAGPGAVRA